MIRSDRIVLQDSASGLASPREQAHLADMIEDDEVECVAECNYVFRRETRTAADGAVLVEDVERCTGCGRVMSRAPVRETPT